MLKKISLKNFKAFEHLNEIEISPLTVIVGKNSSGKSSILHSLLLLKQTLDSSNNESAILLEGKYLKYSTLSEIAHNLPDQETAKIGYSFELNTKKKTTIELSIKNARNELDGTSYHPIVDFMKVTEGRIITNFGKLTYKDLLNRIKKDTSFFTKLLSESEPVIKYVNFIPKSLEVTIKPDEKTPSRSVEIPTEFLLDAARPINMLRREITDIRYLSPVRAMPQRAYIHYSDDTDELREDGGNSAHVFWGKRKQEVVWLGKKYSLVEAVNHCIDCMGLKQKITPAQTGNIIYQIKVEIPNTEKSVTIVDVGFGYSQVIPIVLTGLLNGAQNLMLIEQPEIHLHPSSCANLADLFLGFIKDGKRFIIETHSQDFINRLRLRVIETPELKDKINILFIDSDENGSANAKQFRIDENGSFPEWPSGFIDESEKGARALIKARSKRKEKNISMENSKNSSSIKIAD